LFGTGYAALLNDAQGFELFYGSISVFLRQSERNLAACCELDEWAAFGRGSGAIAQSCAQIPRHPQRENPQF
jgi:hypothetical protein